MVIAASCQPGTKLVGGVCLDCEYDSYTDEQWQTSCKSCGVGKVTQAMKADNIDLCIRKFRQVLLQCWHGHTVKEIYDNLDLCFTVVHVCARSHFP